MGKSNLAQERRRSPRAEGNIPVKISSSEFDLVTETKNLSKSGVYCRVNKYIEPMTKLRMHLLFSFKKKNKIANKKISCDGVIVRSEAIPGNDYFNVAIYFSDINSRDAEYISDFINTTFEK